MGCAASSVRLRVGLSEMLLIQGETKSAFRKDAGLRHALHHIASIHRQQGEHDASIEEIAALTVADTRDLKTTIPAHYAGPALPEGNIKTLMAKFEEALLVRLRNTVKPRVLNSIPEKEKGDSKATDDAAEDVLIAATRTCVIQELLDLILPAYHHFAPAPPVEREILPAEPAVAGAEVKPEEHPAEQKPADESNNNNSGAAAHSEPQPGATDSSNAGTTQADHKDETQKQQEQPKAAEESKPAAEPAPAKAEDGSSASESRHDEPASNAPPTAGAAVVASEPEQPSLRYPLPEGTWTQCEDNPDFWWGEDAGLFYFPSAGHFMDAESGMWYIESEDKWLTAEEHEYYLSEMAQRGEY